jgi:hypothetical protein
MLKTLVWNVTEVQVTKYVKDLLILDCLRSGYYLVEITGLHGEGVGGGGGG